MNLARFKELWFEQVRKGIGLGIKFRFSRPDASRDVCKRCGKERRVHPRQPDHPFTED